MIDLNNISRNFDGKILFKNFNYSFDKGLYCILGPNGCGKSTLLKIIAGLDSGYQGELTLPANINSLRTYLPDVPTYHPFMKAYEFLEMVSKIRGINHRKYIDNFSEDFKLNDILDLKLEKLSLGQTKRLFCCITLIEEAPIWILDEPSNGLDNTSRKRLIEAIKQHSETGGIVIMSEHNESTLKELGEYSEVNIKYPQ